MARIAALLAGVCLAMAVTAVAEASDAIPVGSAEETADLGDIRFTVFTYKPEGCAPQGLLLVFHGVDRNADTYRDNARPLADKLCRVVIAPLFDKERFPNPRYQAGGIAEKGAVLPPAQWSVALVPRLAEWARRREGSPSMPYDLLGHSAGAQFLSRVAAFGPDGARRIVIANPSTHVRARLDIEAPFGFGGAYAGPEAEAALKRYLAQPVTILLGTADRLSRNLAQSGEAKEQGDTRYGRGQFVFGEARDAAARHGWPFNWRLLEVPDVGHNAKEMFASRQALEALQP